MVGNRVVKNAEKLDGLTVDSVGYTAGTCKLSADANVDISVDDWDAA